MRDGIDKIAALLAENKISQAEFARLIGVTSMRVSRWLRREHKMPAELLTRIAAVLGVTVDALLTDASELPPPPEGWVSIPVIGRVPAGMPLEAIEEYDGEVTVPTHLIGRRQVIALRISGNSMAPTIRNGDVVLVEMEVEPAPGKIVVVRVNLDGEVTCKRFFRDGDTIILQPDNPEHRPIVIGLANPGAVHIVGKVIQLIRDME